MERLTAELAPISQLAIPVASQWLEQAESRFRRIAEAFRDRLGRNVRNATGVAISPVDWEAKRPDLSVVPVAITQAFMTHWDLLWWLLPMGLVGGLFRRHVLGRVPWEVEKNLTRLAGDWGRVIERSAADLRGQASARAEAELSTLDRLLGQRLPEVPSFEEALRRLAEAGELATALD